MFWELSNKLACLMIPEAEEEDKEVYSYGIWILLTTIFNTLEILFLGVILHRFLESLIYLFVLMVLRTYTGGYHANTSMKCNILVIGFFLLNLLGEQCLVRMDNKGMVYTVLLLSELVIWNKAPIENDNKPLSEKEKVNYRRYSIILSLGVCMTVVFLGDRYERQMVFMALSMGMVALTMLLELILERRRMNNEQEC